MIKKWTQSADGLSIFTKPSKEKKVKKLDILKYTPQELAERIMNGMKRDHGRWWLNWMGVDPQEIKKYDGDALVALSEEVSSWPRKEPETCEACGQDL